MMINIRETVIYSRIDSDELEESKMTSLFKDGPIEIDEQPTEVDPLLICYRLIEGVTWQIKAFWLGIFLIDVDPLELMTIINF